MIGPDIVAIVDGIRLEIEARRAAGAYRPEDLETLLLQRLEGYIAEAKIDPRIGARLVHDTPLWNIDTGYWIRSRRPGVAGMLLRGAKRLVRPFVRLYTDHILNRQAQLNLVMWRALVDLGRRTAQLEIEVRRLREARTPDPIR